MLHVRPNGDTDTIETASGEVLYPARDPAAGYPLWEEADQIYVELD